MKSSPEGPKIFNSVRNVVVLGAFDQRIDCGVRSRERHLAGVFAGAAASL